MIPVMAILVFMEARRRAREHIPGALTNSVSNVVDNMASGMYE
jgi:hypothetical protein